MKKTRRKELDFMKYTLSELRNQRELTISQFAKAIGTKPTTVRHWEEGKAKIPTIAKYAISAFFGIRASELLNTETQKPKGLIFCIIGNSASGKTTIANALFPKEQQVISYTSRPMREGEENGVDYYFTTKNEMLEMQRRGELLEFITFHDQYYGYSIKEVEAKAQDGMNCACVINSDGLKAFLECEEIQDRICPIFVFNSKEQMEKNLHQRNDTEEAIKQRLSTYDKEIQDAMQLYLTTPNAKMLNTTRLTKPQMISYAESLINSFILEEQNHE